MKSYLLIAFVLAGLVTGVSGQDRIITLTNDTVQCKISKVTRNDIYFDINTGGVKTSGKMPLTAILSYSVNTAAATSGKPDQNGNDFYPRLRLSLSGGAGYLFSSSEKAEESMVGWGLSGESANAYYKNLRTGMCASGDLAWMVTPRIGVGLRYKYYDTQAALEGLFDPQEGLYLFYSTYSEQIYVNFAGASLLFSEPAGSAQQLRIYAAIAAGVALYRNESESFPGNYLITGKTIGMDGNIGLEYFIKPFMAVSAELSAFYGSLRKFELTDGTDTQSVELEKENYENLSRIDLSLGIRFYLWNR